MRIGPSQTGLDSRIGRGQGDGAFRFLNSEIGFGTREKKLRGKSRDQKSEVDGNS